MVNELGPSDSRQPGTSDGFSAGTAVSSFAGALVALLVGGGVATVLWPQAPIVTTDNEHPVVTHENSSLQVAATGAEEFVRIDNSPASVALTFDEPGYYRIELRALDGSSDPVLTLFAAGSEIPYGTNDDAPGTLDAILPVQVTNAGDTWRVDLTSFAETQGPAVLRVMPAAEGEEFAPLMTSGPGAFPSDDVSVLASGEPTETSVGQEGVWYTFKPATSGVHILSIRAADDSFDTVASLIPVLPGQDAPMAGTDVTTLPSAFSSDDDDGLNPRFAKYLQEGAAYYLFVRSFEAGTQGSIAISLELANADTPMVLNNQMEDVMEEMHDDMMVEPEEVAPSGSGKLNAH
jgi:hypothetical protein